LTPDTPTVKRPLRADARRNREKIVAAARAAFAESGLDAQMDEVARRAGVGVGTLYRHFPTKDALVEGLVVAHMEGMAERARAALAASGEPWPLLAAVVRDCASTHLRDRALAEVMTSQPASTFRVAAETSGLRTATAELLARAQAAGTARKDARAEDVGMLMCGLGAVLTSWGPREAERYLGLMLDGLRATTGDRLPD
jgi:AcrR family transcriptional regulator